MADLSIEDLCELGQDQLIRTRYLEAESTFMRAEALAQSANDWDRLSRLYMPLQEARRQRRQLCGEGLVRLDLLARGPDEVLDPASILEQYPHGQLLIAGWGTLEPARRLRALAAQRGLYVESFLAAAYPASDSIVVLIAPEEQTPLPPPGSDVVTHRPTHCLLFTAAQLPHGATAGTPQTYGRVMGMWEQLHAPFLAAADAAPQPLDHIAGYRRAIRVDYACELAHQNLSSVARKLVK
jgi:hypothetical protein